MKNNYFYIKNIFKLFIPSLLTVFVHLAFDIADRAIIGRLDIDVIAKSSMIHNYIYYDLYF